MNEFIKFIKDFKGDKINIGKLMEILYICSHNIYRSGNYQEYDILKHGIECDDLMLDAGLLII